jgi:uncharacterized protein
MSSAVRYCTRLVLVVSIALGIGHDLAAQTSTYKLFLGGRELGSEQVTVSTTNGLRVTATGTYAPPLDLTLRRAEAQYGPDGRPIRLTVDALVKGSAVLLTTNVADGKAQTQIVRTGQQTSEKTDAISANALVLGSGALFVGASAALGPRLVALQPGGSVQAYVSPEAEIAIQLDSVTSEQAQTERGRFVVRRHLVTFKQPQPLQAEVWTDERGGFLRLLVPAHQLDFVREDLASVHARQTKVWRENDETVMVPASGFNLGATISRPKGVAPPDEKKDKPERLPAVVLVGGSGPLDRDETVFGVPVMGQLASTLADAGYLVIRYDKRGVGQSGGRAEAATIADYADDVVAIVRYLARRKDVDSKRLAIVGHSEGAWLGLLAADREDKVAAVALLAGAGTTGAALNLEQQRRLLDAKGLKGEEREKLVAQQITINNAVLSGADWDKLPEALRKQADSPWFRSFLAFDPSKVVAEVRQPILIVQGERDTQVPPHHAGKLDAMARARKKGRGQELVQIPGVNHLFVKATTGEVSEYATLPDKTITPGLGEALVKWLPAAFQANRG